MSDGKKWAAEEELRAHIRAEEEYTAKRVLHVRRSVHREGFTEDLIKTIDEARAVFHALRLGDKPLRYEDHVQVRKLSALLSSLDARTKEGG